ncbi:MAG: DegT/DnrJ/EryC1/StrS family aminotransferase [Bacteroidetes bacterium]|nr:DegT/DnrJ/EryC1/StrS family aminotransferase [Bacteroidota bacterium]
MKIPFVDLKVQYQSIKQEIDFAIQYVLDNTVFILGKSVEDFERKFAEVHEAKYCVGTNSGTSALHVALNALLCSNPENLRQTNEFECIVPINTYIATAEAVSATGAKVVFVDNNEYYNIDIIKIEEKITENTKVIIPVHLYGQPADMDSILKLAEKYNLFVLEDCAQAHLSRYKGKPVGSFGDISAFSFYPGKNLGAYGEAGACVTNNEELFNHMMRYRNHGQDKKYYHEIIGHNFRMEGIQGAVLGVKLKYLHEWTESRRKNAYLYNELLKDIPKVITSKELEDVYAVYHLYVIQIKDRENLIAHLKENGIETGLHYPIPIHLQNAYKHLGYKRGDFPRIESEAERILSLPMYPELTETQIRYVVDKIREFYAVKHAY